MVQRVFKFMKTCSVFNADMKDYKIDLTKAKQPESGDLCGNITAGSGDPSATPNSVILPYRSPDESCFVVISYCLMILYNFQLRYMR